MAYQALARKWRPQSFRDIIGQQTAVRTLQNAIEQKRIHHAYLFSGVRGIGKTTSARILAKALNCEKGPTAEPCNVCVICREITEGIDLDVREIDAATYSKAEDVREIREVLQFQPVRDRYRIFIIDEVHSLSGQAWNALLKQIEEPPPHVIFMMATTEIQKVPPTILSRVQQLALRKITSEELLTRLEEICRAEGIDAEKEALEMVTRRGEGSVRDSLSVLDQVIAFGGRQLTATDVAAILGLSGGNFLGSLIDAIEEGSPGRVLELLDQAAAAGRDFKILFRDLLDELRTLLLVAGGAPERMLITAPGEMDALRERAARFDYAEILRILNLLIRDDELVSRSEQQRLAVEIALLKAATLPRLRSIEAVIAGGGGSLPPARGTTRPSQPRVAAPATPKSSTAEPKPRPSSATPSSPKPGNAAEPTKPSHSAGTGDFRERLIRGVASSRRAAGSYLDSARAISIEGNDLIIEFDSPGIEVDYLSEPSQLDLLGTVASEIAERRLIPRVRSTPQKATEGTPKKESAINEDPVIRAFQKHLGGEVIPRSPDTRTRRTDEH